MTETGVPYVVGEQPTAEKSLAQVAWEAACRDVYPPDLLEGALTYWPDLNAVSLRHYRAIAPAVQAEALQRAIAHLEALAEGLPVAVVGLERRGFRRAIRELREYARQAGESQA